MDINKLLEIKARNLAAMKAENEAKAAADKVEAERLARVEREFPSRMVAMVDLVLSCPGRPLPSPTVRRLAEIRSRHAAKVRS